MPNLSAAVDISIAHVGDAAWLGDPNSPWLAVLDAHERERRSRLRFASDRNLFALAHVLLRTELSRHADVPPAAWIFTHGPHGKPLLTPELMTAHGLHFSLSHAGATAVCAVTRVGAVGVDVESLARTVDTDALADEALTPAEQALLAGRDAPARVRGFLTHWTLKEAYLKGLGVGLSMPLRNIGFSHDPGRVDPPRLVVPAADGERWLFDTRQDEADVVSTAVQCVNAAFVSFRYRYSRVSGADGPYPHPQAGG